MVVVAVIGLCGPGNIERDSEVGAHVGHGLKGIIGIYGPTVIGLCWSGQVPVMPHRLAAWRCSGLRVSIPGARLGSLALQQKSYHVTMTESGGAILQNVSIGIVSDARIGRLRW